MYQYNTSSSSFCKAWVFVFVEKDRPVPDDRSLVDGCMTATPTPDAFAQVHEEWAEIRPTRLIDLRLSPHFHSTNADRVWRFPASKLRPYQPTLQLTGIICVRVYDQGVSPL
jgi:hypothetical protein